MATYYPDELGPCTCRIAAATERLADEAEKQTAILAHIAEEHETQTWLMERIAVATECQCNCCTSGHWRSDALMEVSMGNPYNSAPERLEMYRELLKTTQPTTDGTAPDELEGEP